MEDRLKETNYEKLSEEYEIIGKKIVDAAYTVHKNL